MQVALVRPGDNATGFLGFGLKMQILRCLAASYSDAEIFFTPSLRPFCLEGPKVSHRLLDRRFQIPVFAAYGFRLEFGHKSGG